MMTMKHATKTLMHRRNKAPHYGFKRSKLRMTARNRLCFLDSAWKDVAGTASGTTMMHTLEGIISCRFLRHRLPYIPHATILHTFTHVSVRCEM